MADADVRDVPADYVLYAPPAAMPQASAFPTSPVSADAVVLTALKVLPECSGGGLGRVLVQAVDKNLARLPRVYPNIN